ncbi:MAG: RNA-binding S4 domain-containing protein [Saprospiraceae bacterium]|nr:RNA-binding S4 domain-containing protein [Saprospiraceae bacterium]
MAIKTRIDKWLWSVRIYKTRTLASDEVRSGKVKINQSNAKPASNVQAGDLVTVKKNGFNFQFKVIEVIEKRVAAPIAQQCYQDHTPQEELNKYNDWFIGKFGAEMRDRGAGRPTKKDRREIDDFKENYFDDFDE